MTIAFTSIIAIFIIERIDEKKGTISLIPLLVVGVVSILYWRQVYYNTHFHTSFLCCVHTCTIINCITSTAF